MEEYKHFKLPSPDKRIGLRLVDFIIFALLLGMLFWLLILTSEFGDLEKTVHRMQMQEGR